MLFLKSVSSKEVHFCFAKRWTWRLDLLPMNKYFGHQQDFRETNLIDWEEWFANKIVETYIFLRLMSYFLNIYLNYIVNKTVDNKDPLDWIRTVPSNGKAMLIVKNILGQEKLYSTLSPLKMDIIANLVFWSICILLSLLL